MAKEVDLKIELNVSVNCCDGCKRKVKKALRNVEGVLKTEIDPLQPKVTVLGNVDPQILIKKIQKVGKQAFVHRSEEQKAVKKEAETIGVTTEKEKQISCVSEQEKPQHPCAIKTDKSKGSTEDGDVAKTKASKKDNKEIETDANPSSPQDLKKENPTPPLCQSQVNFTIHPSTHIASDFKNHPQYCYIAQPCAIALPYYAVNLHAAPPLPPSYGQHYYQYDNPKPQPPFLAPTVQAGDYFSDENTVGCSVM
ncbi:Heavy metal-associated isoprenylated plant protein 36 [Quillaja saponaria]|uniref:Heavy metal-associated isoprenylated plant protein 36 n=1 Tax=Quillaja saponaria TaxID=32244 RepID=A0AAD7VDN5_QUISA|nr:Heavy metal-associated isoprenylated plant protein 36 [Quillaja saponaria]